MTSTTSSADLDLLLALSVDLTAALSSEDRYRRLVDAVRRVLPCDATAILRLDGDALVPVAAHGLTSDALGRRYAIAEHPRLGRICETSEPVVFPPDLDLPDPFDGMLACAPSGHRVHACLGCSLRVEGELVGALTADAMDPHAFDGVDERMLGILGALAGAATRTSALIEALERESSRRGLVARDLGRVLAERRGGELIGASPPMERLRGDIELVARSDFTVLVTGETGSGKELVVHALHAASERSTEPLIYVNCAALPEAICESELFGHVRGAFTGADADRAGKFEVADGGTLFLDEIGELPLAIQAKLLRVLQGGEIQRVGAERSRRVDVRVVAATNRELEAEVEAGRFRLDLFHRLDVCRLRVPPLRERGEDVALLAGFFCDLAQRRLGLGPVRVTREARTELTRAPWPGNVRELENVILRAVLRASADSPRGGPLELRRQHLGLDPADRPGVPLPDASVASPTPPPRTEPVRSLRQAVEAYRARLIRDAVEDNDGNWAAAARDLGMHRSNLHALAKRLGLLHSRS